MMWFSRGPTRARRSPWLFLLALLWMVPVTVVAQTDDDAPQPGAWGAEPEDEDEDEGPEPGEIGPDGMPYRDCSADAVEEMRDDLTSAPVGRDVLPSGLSPEEAERVRAQIYDVTTRQIAQLDEMLRDMPADYPRRADVLFRLAEAHWEIAESDYMAVRASYNACIDDWMGCRRDEPCVEPVPDYTAALDQYREILGNHPDYERYDEVLFRLGDGLIQNDQAAEGIQYLTRLVNNYPESVYIPESHFLIGDHFFDNDLLIAARDNYNSVLEYPRNDYYNFAIYKLAWIDLNEHEYRSAVQRFQEVVANLDTQERGGQEVRFDLRTQSVNDMLVAWTEIEDGWVEARQYLRDNHGEDFMRRKLLAMSDLYDEKGKDEERVALMNWFVETYPMDPAMPTWVEYISDSLTKIGDWDRYEAAVREHVRYLDPNGSWGIQNAGDERAMSMARTYAESAFLGVIQRNYQEAQRLSRQELYEEVAEDYGEFFDRFPDSDEAYEQRFFYAEVLYYNIEDHTRAGEQYLEVVRMDPEGEHSHDSIVGALQAFDDLMKTEVPDIDEERQIMSSAELESIREQGLPEQDLGPWSQRYVEVVEYFAELFPEDERIPVASWRAAELYRRANRIGEAAARFETIIEHHPTHRFAEEAAISAFLCYQYVENWERIEHWARFLLEQNMETADFNRERLSSAVAYAINQQAQDLVEGGQQFEAAEMMIALYHEFPESEFAPTALFNAAAIYEQARRVDTAVDTYTTFLEAYPTNDLVPEARFTLGLIHDSQANFAEAATWFEAVSEFEDYELHDDAVFNAARLREAMSEFDRAIEHYDHYIARTNDPEQAPSLLFRIAQIEEDRGNLDAAFARYQQIRDQWGGRPSVRLAATVLQARVRAEQGNIEGARALYRESYDLYGAGALLFDETTHLPSDWQAVPGWQIEDPDERLLALPYAAESRFHLADQLFETAQAITLEYPEGRWRVLSQNLISRAEAVQAAERAMFEVIWMGDAAWIVAAATRIGELYKKFYDDMYALPAVDLDECIDDGHSYEDCEELDTAYNDMLYEQMYPIETKARDSLAEALAIAHENVVYNEWTGLAVQRMVQVDRNLRVVGEEGVEANDRGSLYTGTAYMTDLDAVLARFEELERQALEAQRAAQGGGQPGESQGVVEDGSAPDGEAPDRDGEPEPDDDEADGGGGPVGSGAPVPDGGGE